MADELNIPTHRWYQKRNHIALAKEDFSRQYIYDSGIQKIDAWINSQPWGNPIPYLFANNEPGVWYDPSDLDTLFQDTAGTTPVTTAGQTVGLMLDKSQGLTLGPELVTNGDFSDGATGWTLGPGWSIADGVATHTSGGGAGELRSNLFAEAGETYRIRFELIENTGSGFARISVGADVAYTTAASTGANGVLEATVTWSGVGTGQLIFEAFNLTQVNVDNISVKELPGYHATQPTAAARPTYGYHPQGGIRNLLTRTEEFDDAVWAKLNVTVSTSTVVDPAGGTSARLLTPKTGSVTWVYSPQINTGVVTSISVFAKYSGKTWMSQSNSTGSIRYASFNLLTGEVGTVASGYTATMESAGDGWYRCAVTTPTNFNDRAIFAVSDTDGGLSATPNGSDGIYIWGAQLETGSTATDYQRVGNEYDVTEAGVPSVHYLAFDGVDDTMGTSAFIQTGGGFYAAHGFNVLSEGGNAAAGDSFGSLRNVDRESVGWRSSGTYQYGSRLRVSGGVSYLTNFTITGGTGSFGNNYVGDGWHDGLTLNARLSNGQSSSEPAVEAATGTPQVLTLVNDSNYMFFGGIFRDGPPPSSDTRDQVQQYLADKTGVTLA